jgi:Tfp pilus assembly protein PilX
MRARLRSERGSVLITAMILMTIMLAVGLATYGLVDSQTRESGFERMRETSFNVGEGLLGSQVFILSRGWPGTVESQYPTCANGTSDSKCPNATGILADFGGVDVNRGVSWQTRVVDNALDSITGSDAQTRCTSNRNATPSYYSDSRLVGAESWDANGDCRLWVRSTASIAGRRRTFVGLVRVEQVNEEFPKNTITAGWFETRNEGNKVLVDTKGDSAQPAPVAVRCPAYGSGCADYNQPKGQVSPDTVSYDYPSPTALSAAALDRLRERAQAIHSYYATGCPPSLAGPLVFVENADCSYTGNSNFNTEAFPGVLVFARGTLSISGNVEYQGLIYMANLQGSSGIVLELGGNSLVQGGVAVDGSGGVSVGESKMNLMYDKDASSRVVSFGNAGIIQNTWREIPATS